MEEPHLHKIFIGKLGIKGEETAQDLMEQPWETAMFKEERNERIWLWKDGLEGDNRVDLKKSGQGDRPLFVYPIKHYTYWNDYLNRNDMELGSMGENFSVLEMDEYTVCIGDVYQIGEVIVEVSEPMLPSWKHARRHKHIDLALHMQQTGKTGWHFRVVKEGYVKRDAAIELVERPYPQWTIQAVNEIIHIQKDDLRVADELLTCEKLGLNFQVRLKRRMRGKEVADAPRLYGPNK